MRSGIVCRDLTVSFFTHNGGRRIVLDHLNATFPAGRISVISGAVGAGKSTLLHILAGLMRPTSGEVIADGRAVSRFAGLHRDRWRRQVGIVFQHHHLLVDLTVLENVMLPLIPLGYSLAECRRRCHESLRKVALMHHAGSRVNTLSGGERQKVAIARALVSDPLFVFADEPTAHQDSGNTRRVMNLLSHAAGGNAVVVLATHETKAETVPVPHDRYRLEGQTLYPVTP